MKLTCSIALITYNGERFLARQLETLANQTRLPDELVVCDDCSQDRTVEILEAFAKNAPFPVRIFRNEKNLGVDQNFQKALFLCEKEVVFFCDQDDVWLPHKIEMAMEIFEAEPETGLVLMTDLRVDKNEKFLPFSNRFIHCQKLCKKEYSFEALLDYCMGWAAHNIACRTSWREVIFSQDYVCFSLFDIYIFHMLGALSDTRVVVEPTLLFRRHGDNVTSHSRHTKNPFKLMVRAIKRHYRIDRLCGRCEFYRMINDTLSHFEVVRHPSVAARYRNCAQHLERRLSILTTWFTRFWLVPTEIFNGNYSRYSRGLRDAITDFIAPPQKRPK